MKLNKSTIKITVLFALMSFLALTLTTFFMVGCLIILDKTGLSGNANGSYILLAFALASIVIGFLFTNIVSRKPLRSIVAFSAAAKEVAKGNFDVKLDENIPAVELRELAHSFNVMTKELSNTEMFRNDFIENVSHEFKTPLNSIEGYVTLLQRPDLSDAKRQEYTRKILSSTKRLSTLTGNILLLSRLEHQELAIKKERFSLDEHLRENILLLERQWNAKQIELDIDLDSADYVGNCELLAQVWQNLLGNAIKYVNNGGTIQVLLRRASDAVTIQVTDNGIGMSEEVAARVYEKFYQGDTSRTSSGNGLGLTLAKRIVDLHGGTISVTSAEGKGTTFTVVLPLNPQL